MLTKLFLVTVLVILVQFNGSILAEDDPVYHKPECNETKPKWTEQEVEDKCYPFLTVAYYKIGDYEIDNYHDYSDFPKYGKCKEKLKSLEIYEKVCCEGFKRVDDEKCVMDCKYHCKHGECDDKERCSCAIGFGGRWCETPCPAGHFGLECEHNCDCLTSPECNPNYQQCRCDGGSITAECENICKCRLNPCNPGRIGKNCTETCPDGSYGPFCSRTCSCVKENTRECVKESGDCVCKDRFYGLRCERKCTGTRKCDTVNEVERAELVIRSKDTWIIGLIVGLLCLAALLLVSSLLTHRYKVKSKRLKKEIYSLRYSSDGGNVTLNNSIYTTNLLDDHLIPNQPIKTTGFLEALKSSHQFNRMKTGKSLNAESLKNDSKQLKDEETTYSTVNELKKETKSDDPAV